MYPAPCFNSLKFHHLALLWYFWQNESTNSRTWLLTRLQTLFNSTGFPINLLSLFQNSVQDSTLYFIFRLPCSLLACIPKSFLAFRDLDSVQCTDQAFSRMSLCFSDGYTRVCVLWKNTPKVKCPSHHALSGGYSISVWLVIGCTILLNLPLESPQNQRQGSFHKGLP